MGAEAVDRFGGEGDEAAPAEAGRGARDGRGVRRRRIDDEGDGDRSYRTIMTNFPSGVIVIAAPPTG